MVKTATARSPLEAVARTFTCCSRGDALRATIGDPVRTSNIFGLPGKASTADGSDIRASRGLLVERETLVGRPRFLPLTVSVPRELLPVGTEAGFRSKCNDTFSGGCGNPSPGKPQSY